MKSTAIYVRVSSRQQDQASQLPDLTRWAEISAGDVTWYRDTYTGKTMDRPAFNELIEHVRAGHVGRIVVWRLDRLGRTAQGLTALFAELQKHKTTLVSLKDGIDLATAAGKLMAHVLASVAEYENEVRSERIRAGQDAARARGKRWGGSKKGRRLKVTPQAIRQITEMRNARNPIAWIARSVKLSRGTVYGVIREIEKTQKRGEQQCPRSKSAGSIATGNRSREGLKQSTPARPGKRLRGR